MYINVFIYICNFVYNVANLFFTSNVNNIKYKLINVNYTLCNVKYYNGEAVKTNITINKINKSHTFTETCVN